MTPEKQRLFADTLNADQAALREATLLAGGRILQRKRTIRAVFRAAGVAAVLALAAVPLLKSGKRSSPPAVVSMAAPASAQPKALTDEELLALFPDTPVALASLENGQKRLIFPRAGDEEKFVTKL